MITDIITQIHQAIDATAVVVHAITEDQWHLPTPCADWDVRAVANHLVGGMLAFPELLAGVTVDDDPTREHVGTDPASAFDAAARADHDAWSRPDALDGTVALTFATLPASMAAVIHLTELVVHGLDLAVATGQHDTIDEHLVEQLLDLMHSMGGIDAFRSPGFFGPEVHVNTAQPAHQRLLAYVGRNITCVAA
ncbi:MAG TPA: TIGR03086 family metal-binding protein [Ilumatobacteraceae bacterium]|nr:TIGR03086 family metal-binding protein [Ilumatobacteraceae bacterium]